MADKVKNTKTLYVDFYLTRGTESTTRSISFETQIADANIKANVGAFRLAVLGDDNYSKIIQPSNWRDSDESEEEYLTNEIGARLKTTTELTFDFS